MQHGMGLPVGQVDYDQMSTGPRKDDQRQVVTSGIRLFRSRASRSPCGTWG